MPKGGCIMKTFIELSKTHGHKNIKSVRRWQVQFALSFNISLKQYINENTNTI